MGFFHKLNKFFQCEEPKRKIEHNSNEIINAFHSAKDVSKAELIHLINNKKSEILKPKELEEYEFLKSVNLRTSQRYIQIKPIIDNYYESLEANNKAEEAEINIKPLLYFEEKYPNLPFIYNEDSIKLKEKYDLVSDYAYNYLLPIPQYITERVSQLIIDPNDVTYYFSERYSLSTCYSDYYGTLPYLVNLATEMGYKSLEGKHPIENKYIYGINRQSCIYLYNNKLSILLQPVTHNKINSYLILASWER